MLPNFTYVRPTNVRRAIEQLSTPGSQVHAGGTDVLGCLRDRVFSATKLVALTGISELSGIGLAPDSSLRIGTLTTLAEIAAHPLIAQRYAALAQGAAAAASPQLRNQGTIEATCATARVGTPWRLLLST
jgi:xanthine dehydrogenase YagS FAD-binding subunit